VENFQNEIVWKRTGAHSSAKRYGPAHDVLLFYGKGAANQWNTLLVPHGYEYIGSHYSQEDEYGRKWRAVSLTGPGTPQGETGKPWRGFDPTTKDRHWAYLPTALDEMDANGLIYWPKKEDEWPRQIRFLEQSGAPIQDVWTDIAPINSQAQERLGYPTQKPLALLERILNASSNIGDVVLDPFCGCGTAVHAAQKLGRSWIGIDITHLAISLIEKRLKDAFPGIKFDVHGTPKDLEGAADLALRDKYQFQWWACSLVNAQPFQGKKKGADGGIDGLIYFADAVGGKQATQRIVVSV